MMREGTLERRSFSRELRTRVDGEYYLQLPAEGNDEPSPLLVFLHGMYHAETLFELDAPPKIARDRGLSLVVLSPLCADMRWNIDVVLGLIEEVREQVPIDGRRIYATGISIGALATWELALRRPELLAAIVPICGAGQPYNAFRIAHVPTWVFHGAQDEVVPVSVSTEMAEALRSSGGTPRLTIYDDEGHRSWGRAYSDPELWSWLLDQRAPA